MTEYEKQIFHDICPYTDLLCNVPVACRDCIVEKVERELDDILDRMEREEME